MSCFPFDLIDKNGRNQGNFMTSANAVAVAIYYKLEPGWKVQNIFEQANDKGTGPSDLQGMGKPGT